MDERKRLEVLSSYDILDSAPEQSFDDLVLLASQICGVPLAAIGLMDYDREWFKSRIGIELEEIPRKTSISNHTLRQPEVYKLESEEQLAMFSRCPFLQEPYRIRFYAGVALVSREGYPLGTLAVMDFEERQLTRQQAASLRILSRQIVGQMELRRRIIEFEEAVAEHQATVQSLRQTEEKYHGIFDNVVEGIYQTTPDGHYISANRMLAKIYGYDSPDELIQDINAIETQIYIDPKRREEFIRELNEREIISQFESQVYRKDGSVIWISENARGVHDKKGRLLYYEGTVEDITEQKKAEEALRNSEALYHSLVENLPQNIFRKDLDERFTFANAKFCRTLGRPLEEIIGKTDFDFFPPQLAKKYQQDDKRVIGKLEPFETVEEYMDPERGKCFVDVVKTPLFNAHDELIGVQGIFWDVTERRKIEETLVRERQLHQALMDSSPDRIFFKDTQSRFIKVGQSLVEYFGLNDPSEIIGKTDLDFYPPELANEFLSDERKILRTGQPLINKVEKHVGPGGGKVTWTSVTKFPIWNRKGKITGLIGLARDITQLKEAEEELAKARDQALDLADAKAEFLANMSHEIRTPMNAIIGMSSLLAESELNEEQREFVRTISNSAEGLLSIVNDLLDFSKMEAGKMVVESLDFDLDELLGNAVEIFAERAQSKGLELIGWIHRDTPVALRGDPARLRQVIINLVNNAVKFTSKGEVIVEVRAESQTKTKCQLLFEVKDTGIGIAKKTIPQLFQAFTQADGSMARKFGGTGLGLAIVKEIVTLLGGAVGIESLPGKGSVFWFRLPFQKQSKAAKPRARGISMLRNTSVALICGNPPLTEVLQDQLKAFHVQVVPWKNSSEGVKELKKEKPKRNSFMALLLDAGPSLDRDLEVLYKTVRLQNNALPPVVLLSPLTKLRVPEKFQEIITAKIYKPIRRTRLVETLTKLKAGKPVKESQLPGAQGVARERISPLRILLAEDNSVNTDLALRQLRKLGYQAEAAGNGMDVLERIGRENFDVILMDCQMPEMDGYTATRLIREFEKQHSGEQPEAPVYIIAMTANALLGDREKCLEAGMNDYITKPVRLPDLRSALTRAIRARVAPEGAPPAEFSPPGYPPGETADIPILDMNIINGLKELGEDEDTDPLGELTELFYSDTKSRLAEMESALEGGNKERLINVAHALKGSASNFGAHRLANECFQLEKCVGEDAKPAAIKKRFESIRKALKQVQEAIDRLED